VKSLRCRRENGQNPCRHTHAPARTTHATWSWMVSLWRAYSQTLLWKKLVKSRTYWLLKTFFYLLKILVSKIYFLKLYPSQSESKFGRYNRHRLLKKGPLSNFGGKRQERSEWENAYGESWWRVGVLFFFEMLFEHVLLAGRPKSVRAVCFSEIWVGADLQGWI
jgi:hypothetical protein